MNDPVVLDAILRLTLPYAVSVNGLYVPIAKGVMRLSETGRVYKEQVGWLARAAFRDEPVGYEVAFQMEVYRPRRIGDLSNLIKVVEDALTGIVYVDDGQIVEEHFYRAEDPTYPRVELTVWKA